MTANRPSEADTRLLILHDRADLYLNDLRARFPAMTIEACTTAPPVAEHLQRLQPQVVLTYKCPALPGPAHRPLLDCRSVEWAHVGGAGVEHLTPWNSERLTLTNSAGILHEFLAETMVAALMLMNGKFHRYFRQQQQKLWRGIPFKPFTGQTLLVIGLGHIGQQTARKAKALGLRVLGLRKSSERPEGVDEIFAMDRLHEALAEADFVALHLPLTKQTRHLIDAEALTHMKRTAVLANAARGPVVDEAALIEALNNDTIAGAYLDVFEQEPLPPESPLWDMENVVITPHYSDQVVDWQERFAALFADNLARWLKGEPLLNIVDPARGY